MHFAQHFTPHHNHQALVLTQLYPTLPQCLDVLNLKNAPSQLKLKTDLLSKEYMLIQHAQGGPSFSMSVSRPRNLAKLIH